MNSSYPMQFEVPFQYPVVFTRDMLDPDQAALAGVFRAESAAARVWVLVDEGYAAARPDCAARIERYFAAHGPALAAPVRFLPGGETIKRDPEPALRLAREMLDAHLDRQSYVLAIGGGAVLDAVGFAASIAHRGLRLVRAPTTTLAQNDAGLGVKNGVNLNGVKNALGVFAPPWAVVNDLDALDTLSDADWIGGHAEAFKVALIRDAEFFNVLCADAPALRRRDRAAQERAVIRCAGLHLDHIRASGDPFERGAARPLDFGHWAAHQLEAMSGYTLPHGRAVALGVALDAEYARRMGWLPDAENDRLQRGLRDCGFDLKHPALRRRDASGELELLRGLDLFREHLGGQLTLCMPRGVGASFDVHEVDRANMRACAESLGGSGS
ncbi:MAG: 3-dehydroquinate synthase [Kiritimatiellae bacterium]|nr:3-dehydroquinate synthase [Kiritimatiellia bacterium]